MIRIFALVLFTPFFVMLLASCASSGSGTNPDGTPKDEHSVNTLPWNKPASWEGSGTMPGMGGGGGN